MDHARLRAKVGVFEVGLPMLRQFLYERPERLAEIDRPSNLAVAGPKWWKPINEPRIPQEDLALPRRVESRERIPDDTEPYPSLPAHGVGKGRIVELDQ